MPNPKDGKDDYTDMNTSEYMGKNRYKGRRAEEKDETDWIAKNNKEIEGRLK